MGNSSRISGFFLCHVWLGEDKSIQTSNMAQSKHPFFFGLRLITMEIIQVLLPRWEASYLQLDGWTYESTDIFLGGALFVWMYPCLGHVFWYPKEHVQPWTQKVKEFGTLRGSRLQLKLQDLTEVHWKIKLYTVTAMNCWTDINEFNWSIHVAKTWCRAFEGALAVVTFQAFYRGGPQNAEKRNFSISRNFIIIITIMRTYSSEAWRMSASAWERTAA